MPPVERVLSAVGSAGLSAAKPVSEQAGILRDIVSLFFETLSWIPRRPWRWNEIAHAMVHMGIGSLPVIGVSTAFAGLVVTVEIAWHMDQALHTISMVPGFTGQFIVRELGIAVPALLMVAKVGASMTAEVGTMKVTEQIDAIRLLRIDPVGYLVFPRFIACIVSMTCLTLVAIGVTLSCAIFVAVSQFNFSVLEFLNALRHFVGPQDIVCALVKGAVFGAIIPIISCAFAFRCAGGAKGVGTTTTNAVVASTIAVILFDFLLTYFFTWLL